MRILTTFLLISINCRLFAQTDHDLANRDRNKCYEKCLVIAEQKKDMYPIFTGDVNKDDVETTEVFIYRKERFENKIISTKGTPEDMENYSVNRAVCKVPADTIKVTIVSDINSTKAYYWEYIPTNSWFDNKETTWEEILCDKEIKPAILTYIVNELYEKRFLKERIVGTFKYYTPVFSDALLNYQRASSLPEGGLNIETLKKLKVAGF